MTARPQLLDLFCGGGGMAMGYYRAGFDVRGVDNKPQPHYPFEFVQADAFDYFDKNWWMFDAFHASPLCQGNSGLKNIHQSPEYRERHPDLIPYVREMFEDYLRPGPYWKPWIIENVVGATMNTQVILCGAMFGLRTYRHRLFESNILLFAPAHRKHTHRAASGYKPKEDEFYTISGHFADFHGACRAMGIDWMITRDELKDAVPPVFAEYLGRQLIQAVQR